MTVIVPIFIVMVLVTVLKSTLGAFGLDSRSYYDESHSKKKEEQWTCTAHSSQNSHCAFSFVIISSKMVRPLTLERNPLERRTISTREA